MISKQVYKIKGGDRRDKKDKRYSTDYNISKKSLNKKNKLTKGCINYQQLKDAYLKNGEMGIKIQKENINSEYTFEPKIYINKKKNSRSFKKFIQDQQNFQYNKQQKIKQFKTQISKIQINECSNLPQIDKISKRICTLINYDKQQVVDRLYKKKVIQQFKDDQQLFSPKILPRSKSMKRTQNVSQLLHQDAIRRKIKKQVQQAQKLLTPQPLTIINSNTYQLVCNKMYIEFCQLVSQQEQILPLVIVWTVLSEIFGIELNPNKIGKQGKICQDILQFLCKDGEETVTKQKLWEFIQIIVKKQQAKPRVLREQTNQIIQQFGSLYTYRMAKPKTQRDGQQYSFFPQTLRSSQNKAQKYRQKLIDQAKQFLQNSNSKIRLKNEVTIEDIFVIDHMMKQVSNEKKKIQKQQQQMKQCTFKPRLSESYRKPIFMPPKLDIFPKKILQEKQTLFKSTSSLTMSINQSFMSQSLKPMDLKIKLKKYKKPQQKISNINQIKNLQKTIMRMTIARKQRQLSNQIKNRGYNKSIDNWIEYTQSQKTKIVNQHKKLKGLTYKKIILR